MSVSVLGRLLYAAQARVQPATRKRPADRRARGHPAPRASPFPEVTDPICRLPLPALFHRLEAANLGDLMRL